MAKDTYSVTVKSLGKRIKPGERDRPYFDLMSVVSDALGDCQDEVCRFNDVPNAIRWMHPIRGVREGAYRRGLQHGVCAVQYAVRDMVKDGALTEGEAFIAQQVLEAAAHEAYRQRFTVKRYNWGAFDDIYQACRKTFKRNAA